MICAEADSYWCLCKLLDGIQDHYTHAQPGIQRTVFRLEELVRWAAHRALGWALGIGLQQLSAGQRVLTYSACKPKAAAILTPLCDSDALSDGVSVPC